MSDHHPQCFLATACKHEYYDEPPVQCANCTEPPVGSVARCAGCGNVYVHRPRGWLNTDRRWRTDSWQDIANSFCGPVKVIYNPGEECICDRLAQAESRTADAIRDRIVEYAAGLDGKATRSVALTCAGLATTAGLR